MRVSQFLSLMLINISSQSQGLCIFLVGDVFAFDIFNCYTQIDFEQELMFWHVGETFS